MLTTPGAAAASAKAAAVRAAATAPGNESI